MWYGSSGPSSAHPVGLMGGIPKSATTFGVRETCKPAHKSGVVVQDSTGFVPWRKRKPLSVLGHLSQSRFSPLLWPAHLPLLFAACGGVSVVALRLSAIRKALEGRLLGEVGVVSRCTPRTKENTMEPVRRSRYSPRKDAGQLRFTPNSPTAAWSSKGANFTGVGALQ